MFLPGHLSENFIFLQVNLSRQNDGLPRQKERERTSSRFFLFYFLPSQLALLLLFSYIYVCMYIYVCVYRYIVFFHSLLCSLLLRGGRVRSARTGTNINHPAANSVRDVPLLFASAGLIFGKRTRQFGEGAYCELTNLRKHDKLFRRIYFIEL